MKINIGADELILWLRKNDKASGVTNEILGRKIVDLIYQLQGKKTIDNQDCAWSKDDVNSIGEYKLPKTSAQYEIDREQLSNIYTEISTW